jgi:threonine synthase
MQALAREHAAGRLPRPPQVHTLQTQGAWPLKRAWTLLQGRRAAGGADETAENALRHAAAHRSAYMWPWEEPPHSVATGILDDETYDWMAVLRGMAASGGTAVVADEPTVIEARCLAVEVAGIAASATGSAGLAGVLELQRQGLIAPGARVAVLFTGVQRSSGPPAWQRLPVRPCRAGTR